MNASQPDPAVRVFLEARESAKALLKQVDEAAKRAQAESPVTPADRPGVRTTEFWLTVAAVVLLNTSVEFGEYRWAGIAQALGTALVAMGYTASRAKVKGGGSAP